MKLTIKRMLIILAAITVLVGIGFMSNNAYASTLTKKSANYIGHQGILNYYPGNTVQSFRAAAAKGYYGIECDVYAVNNNGTIEFMVFHDSNLSSLCGVNKSIKEVNSSNRDAYPIIRGNGYNPNVTYKIPTLDEYITACGNKKMFIEVKDLKLSSSEAKSLISTLNRRKILKRTTVISLHKDALKSLRGNSKSLKLMKVVPSWYSKSNVKSDISWSKKNKMNGIDFCYTSMNRSLVKRAKKNKLDTAVWRIHKSREAVKSIKCGVKKITCNSPLWKH